MTTSRINTFNTLHQGAQPLVLSNIWDAASAAIVQSQGAKAIATSSASMAWSLGYADGYQLPTSELLSAIKRIQKVIYLPLTVDIENGYSDDKNLVAELVYQLAEVGVAGINIEDGTGTALLLAEKISHIRNKVGEQLFINARTDLYLQNLFPEEIKLNSTIERLKQYVEAGANCGFVPGLSNISDTKEILNAIDMPLNLMVNGDPQEVHQFSKIGVNRLSLGPKPFIDAYSTLVPLDSLHRKVKDLDYASFNDLFQD